MSVESDSRQEESHTIIRYQMVSLVLTIFITVMCYALSVISKRQEAMLDELLKRSGSMQEKSVLINPETRSQVGNFRPGSGR
jgi:hypothetical protein